MSFAWPWFLFLLAVPLLAAVAYVFAQRRRRRYTVSHPHVALVRAAVTRSSQWRRHLPALLLGLALVASVLGLARPQVTSEVPFSQTSIILALDVSRSMCATDIEPNRLTVAQEAAVRFVESQEGGNLIGLVAFSGRANLIVPPTDDADTLVTAIEGFRTSFGTAVGSATMASLDALASINPDVVPAREDLSANRESLRALDKVADIIVLLTDGATSQGFDPLEAAEQAADRRVRVFTIGFGTEIPTAMVCNAGQAGADFIADSFGGAVAGRSGGDFGQQAADYSSTVLQLLTIDEETLQAMAEITDGQYFRAEDADQLVEVFLNLPSRVELVPAQLEVAWIFVASAGALVAAALALRLRAGRSA